MNGLRHTERNLDYMSVRNVDYSSQCIASEAVLALAGAEVSMFAVPLTSLMFPMINEWPET